MAPAIAGAAYFYTHRDRPSCATRTRYGDPSRSYEAADRPLAERPLRAWGPAIVNNPPAREETFTGPMRGVSYGSKPVRHISPPAHRAPTMETHRPTMETQREERAPSYQRITTADLQRLSETDQEKFDYAIRALDIRLSESYSCEKMLLQYREKKAQFRKSKYDTYREARRKDREIKDLEDAWIYIMTIHHRLFPSAR